MKNAAIYCRVSTEDQEREGTSLQTQLEACLNHCQDKGYKVAYRFSEVYSGLSLERPKLDGLRELVRSDEVDAIVVYCLDRLSRDPTHGVILTQELEKHNVTLEAVTEDVDNTELGKLISYIRNFASKLEAEKIRERTMRGKKAKAAAGRIPSGGFARLYGYDYIKGSGRRIVNENETRWVRQVFSWLVNDGMTTYAIAEKLNGLKVAPKFKAYWSRQTAWKILTNPAYTGRTYYNGLEIPEATPAIIEPALFDAAQRQLDFNARQATGNVKRSYLLHGHIFCRQCGRAYWSQVTNQKKKYGRYEYRRYVCSGSFKQVSRGERCHNKSWGADKLEALVWQKVEDILRHPDLIIAEIQRQRQDAGQQSVFEAELQQIERQLKALDRDQKDLLDNALRGFPENLIITENKKINGQRESLINQRAELEAQLKASRKADINLPKLEAVVELIREKLTGLDFDAKRQALAMLGIKVWLDSNSVEITGVIPVNDGVALQPYSA